MAKKIEITEWYINERFMPEEAKELGKYIDVCGFTPVNIMQEYVDSLYQGLKVITHAALDKHRTYVVMNEKDLAKLPKKAEKYTMMFKYCQEKDPGYEKIFKNLISELMPDIEELINKNKKEYFERLNKITQLARKNRFFIACEPSNLEYVIIDEKQNSGENIFIRATGEKEAIVWLPENLIIKDFYF